VQQFHALFQLRLGQFSAFDASLIISANLPFTG